MNRNRTSSRLGAILVTASMLGAGALAQVAAAAPERGANSAAVTSSQEALRAAMRRLWSDHVFWTREYVVAAIDGPDGAAKAAADRLMRNQEDIGNAVAAYYGAPAGQKLTSLLKQHIQIAVDVVAAAKVGDQSQLQDANTKWNQNANEIADFLSRANPNWPHQALADAMKMHLETTTREVLARLHKDYAQDAAAFDGVYDHILHMSDVLTEGIVKQFPDRFST